MSTSNPMKKSPKHLQVRSVLLSEIKEVAVPQEEIIELQNSMNEIGLLQPVMLRKVKDRYNLVLGRHRVAAARNLKWKTIPAVITESRGGRRRLQMIDENLMRRELSCLERSLLLAERKRILQKIGRVTLRGGDRRSKQASIKKRNPSFETEVADKLNKGKTTVAEETRIGERLDPEAAKLLEGTPIAHRKGDLLRLAAKEEHEQVELAKKIKESGAATLAEAFKPKPKENKKEGSFISVLNKLESAPDEVKRLNSVLSYLVIHAPEKPNTLKKNGKLVLSAGKQLDSLFKTASSHIEALREVITGAPKKDS